MGRTIKARFVVAHELRSVAGVGERGEGGCATTGGLIGVSGPFVDEAVFGALR